MKSLQSKIVWQVAGAVVSALGFCSTFAFGNELVDAQIAKVFVVAGFDDNDEVQVIVNGALPDRCHRLAHTEVQHQAGSNEIHVIQWARRFPGQCPPMFIDFTTVVNIGQLTRGEYVVSAPGLEPRTLTITPATGGDQDDYLYANVTSVYVDSGDGPYFDAEIEGTMTNTCLSWGEIKVINQGDVIVILPVLQYQDNGDCRTIDEPFTRKVRLPDMIPDGYNLVHVRAMNGRSANHVFEVVSR